MTPDQLEQLQIAIRQSIAEDEPAEIVSDAEGYFELSNNAINRIAEVATCAAAAYIESLKTNERP